MHSISQNELLKNNRIFAEGLPSDQGWKTTEAAVLGKDLVEKRDLYNESIKNRA